MTQELSSERSATHGSDTPVNIRWDDANMRSLHSNVCNVTGTREEIILLFGVHQAWQSGLTQQVDVNFASGAKTAVDGVLDKLSTLAGDLQTGASALSQLSSQLPLLDPTTQGSLAQVLGFSQKISTFVTDAESEISSLTTTTDLSTIVNDLNKPGFWRLARRRRLQPI